MTSSKKSRVTVACNRCRRGKRRCDGEMRCQNCVALNAECQYERQDRKTGKKMERYQKHDNLMGLMTKRLDRLESIMLRLADKFGELDKGSDSVAGNSASVVDDLKFESEDDQLSALDSNSEKSDLGNSLPKNRIILTPSIQCGELYFGSHSFFSILSKSSLAWMSEQLGEDATYLIFPFTNLPAIFQKITRNIYKMWLGSLNLTHAEKFRILRSPISQSKQFLERLFQNHAPTFSCASIFFTTDEFLKFLDCYFGDSKELNLDINTLFRATTVILFCLSRAIDMKLSTDQTPSKTSSPPEEDESLEDLTKLKDEYLSNCFYYTHQLSLLGTSLECLQALVFFIIFMDAHVHAPEITHLILIQVASKARDLGLHRIETYGDFDDPVTKLRLNVWSLVSYIDVEVCFRSGKCPLINYLDVSPEIRQHYHIEDLAPAGSATYEFHQWQSHMFDIRLESYKRLFSATANVQSFEVLLNNLDFFNSEMASLALSLSENNRPLFFHDPNFTQIKGIENDFDELRARSLLTFFTHTMLINRVPSMYGFDEMYNEKCGAYTDLSLNSARTILYLLKDFDHKKQSPFPLWMAYLPVSAILQLLAACIAYPFTPEAESDIRLISEICKTHFNRANSLTKHLSHEMDVFTLMEVMVKSMLGLVINIFDTKTGNSFVCEDAAFNESLHLMPTHYPRLFQISKDLESLLGKIFHGKSPFPGGNRTSSHSVSPSTSSDLSLPHRAAYTSVPSHDLMDPIDPAKFLAQFDEVDYFLQSQVGPNPNFFTNMSVSL